ncbi:MAG: bifunctional demethylmenaquinone methyltransferase/2-methoxy-6-polyprenyl-1,4-benzoquinol methylase UbiE [Proteobacteria bacterium]|nr:bifunctional demethylmenaquinone methyltransferase/2-methoxy-6-polyprenyl-1,4-benzoquinol methylase UbiE [Pseudomonadota bacterium]
MSNSELPFIRDMFDTIAHRYDFLNRTLSMKRDVYWRREMVKALNLKKGQHGDVLDVACGTGDVALEAFDQCGKAIGITGMDFSQNMLILAKEKIKQKKARTISLLAGNALCLPFGKEQFDAVTIAFGIRNIGDKKGALEEFWRCMKPGGTLAVLELSTPENRFFHALYMAYFTKILPFVGGFFSDNQSAYQYLPESVIRFPDSETFAGIMQSAGFREVHWKKMTLGIVTLYTGEK